jgi:hypothetical protein
MFEDETTFNKEVTKNITVKGSLLIVMACKMQEEISIRTKVPRSEICNRNISMHMIFNYTVRRVLEK